MAFFKKFIKSFTKIFGLKSASARHGFKRKTSVKKKTKIKNRLKKITPKKKSSSQLRKKAVKKEIPKQQKIASSVSKEFLVGEITHYFSKIQVVVVKVTKEPLKVGDQIHIYGKSDFIQKVASIQIESVDVKSAKKGQLVGLKVNKEASVGDKVFKMGK